MRYIYTAGLSVKVVDVEGSEAPETDPVVPKEPKNDMSPRGVIELIKVMEDLRSSFSL